MGVLVMCSVNNRVKRISLSFLFALIVLFSSAYNAEACCGCTSSDCAQSEQHIKDLHDHLREHTKDEFDDDLEAFENWLIDSMFKKQFLPAMADMATQMSAVSMQYTQIIGAFLDAQNQMDTQRLFRKLQYDAHKDYHPSDDFCWFGTNTRSLAATEAKGKFNALALSRDAITRQMGTIGTAGSRSSEGDYKWRWQQFVSTYCDPGDNNYQTNGTGLVLACDHDGPGGAATVGAVDHYRVNRDINYTRLVEEPRTIEVNFTDNTLDSDNPVIIIQTNEEEDVIALSRNLYGNKVLSRGISAVTMKTGNAKKLYLALRSIAAKRSVAQASFNAIIGLKSAGSAHEDLLTPIVYPSGDTSIRIDKQTTRYMVAIMNQLFPADPSSGVNTAGNILELIGYSPSYYSQLEILAKRIYQNPDFYANLYDTPANVARKKVAMKAIELMIDRSIYESQLRREMNISVLLSSRLRPLHRAANNGLAASAGN